MINSFLSFTSIDVKILNSNSIVSHCVERKDFRFNIADKININVYFMGFTCTMENQRKNENKNSFSLFNIFFIVRSLK